MYLFLFIYTVPPELILHFSYWLLAIQKKNLSGQLEYIQLPFIALSVFHATSIPIIYFFNIHLSPALKTRNKKLM